MSEELQAEAQIRWLVSKGHSAKQTGENPKRYEVDGRKDLTEYEVAEICRTVEASKGKRP